MLRTDEKQGIPLGVKLVAMLTGMFALLWFLTGVVVSIKYTEAFPNGEPGWMLILFELLMAFFFGVVAKKLLKHKKWARRASLSLYGFFFLVVTLSQAQNHTIAAPVHVLISSIFILPLGYLLRPSIRRQFI